MLSLTKTPRKIIEVCQAPPVIFVSPITLNFGTVTVGNTNTLSFTIFNLGGANLSVTSLSLPFPAYTSDFSSGTIDGGGSQIVNITYTPTISGSQNGDIVVNSNSFGGTNIVSVFATGLNTRENSLYCDGVNDTALGTNLNNGNPITNFTWCIGIKNLTKDNSFPFFKSNTNIFLNGILLRRRTNTVLNFLIRDGASNTFSVDITVSNISTSEYYLTWVRSGTSVAANKFYVNGVEVTPTVTSSSVVTSVTDGQYGFGQIINLGSLGSEGILTDFKFFNAPLTPTEVADLYASAPYFNVYPTANCIKDIPFAEKEGANVKNFITGVTNELVLTGYAPNTLVLGPTNAHRDVNGNPILS